MRVYRDIHQGTDEWKKLRKGKPTASRFSDIITAAKGDVSKSAGSYIRELIGECFAPDYEYWSGNAATERGVALEESARRMFCDMFDVTVEQVGFVVADDGICGCSPDGLLTDTNGEPCAGLEIKCPSPKVHIGWVMDGGLPNDYKQQVHGSMAVTGLTEWHFFSYFPGMQPHHVLVGWNDYTEKLKESLAVFVHEYKSAHATMIPKLKI